MKYLNFALDILLKAVMAASTASVLIVSFIQIISRFVAQMSIGWSADVLRLSFIYAVFSGAAYCAKKNEHINLDILLSLLPVRKRMICETVILSVVTVFCAVLTKFGYVYTLSGLRLSAPFLPISMAVYYAALPLCTGIMTFYYLQLIIKNFCYLCKKQGGESACL